MIRVVATLKISADNKDAAMPLFKELIDLTRKENGCIEYGLSLSLDDPTSYVIIENWDTKADLDAHSASEHFGRLIPQLGDLASEEIGVAVFEELI